MLTFHEYLLEYAMRVASANLQSFQYLPEKKLLTIYFRSGGIYQYQHVPESLVNDMKFSESRGRFFWKYIRLVFPYTVLRPARTGFTNAYNIAKSSQPQRHLLKV